MGFLIYKLIFFKNDFLLFFFFFFWTVLYGPIACSLLGVGVQAQNSGYMYNMLCPYIVLVYYHSTPHLQYRPGVSSCTAPYPHFYSSLSDSVYALSFTPYILSLSCSHHLLDNKYPRL